MARPCGIKFDKVHAGCYVGDIGESTWSVTRTAKHNASWYLDVVSGPAEGSDIDGTGPYQSMGDAVQHALDWWKEQHKEDEPGDR